MKTNAFFIRALICFLLSSIPITEIENRIYSARMEFRSRSQSPSGILIVNLESEEFRHLKESYLKEGEPQKNDRMESLRDLFYYDPALFREALGNLINHDPKAILLTWYVPNEVVQSLPDPGLDTLARHRKVLWSSQFDSEGQYMKPPHAFALNTRPNYGFNNLTVDSDGVIRRAQLWREKRPSLTAVLDSLLKGVPLTAPKEDAPKDEFTPLINYSGQPGSVTVCSWSDLLGPVHPNPCGSFKDKIILLTRDAERSPLESLSDSIASNRFQTPLGAMSRGEILAHDINTWVNRQTIYRVGIWGQGILRAIIVLLSAFFIIYYPVWMSALAVSFTWVFTAGVLFQGLFTYFDIYVPASNLSVATLVTYLVFTGYRLAIQENRQWRSVKQAQYLRELDQMKSNFLSLVSHDLKTPIAKIQAIVERMRGGEPHQPALMSEWLESIENSNNELKHYITSILNLSRIESQEVLLNRKSNDINRVIEEALKRLLPLATHRGISIQKELEPLFSVEFDEDLIRQVITNLIDNAIKYSPSPSTVTVRSKEEEGSVWVEVIDQGPGIPKDQLPLMFRKFNRFLHPKRTEKRDPAKGTGLGLYLSKYFIELHGGSIRIQSTEGKGTTLSFSLPVSNAT